jgi:hypothetical protein
MDEIKSYSLPNEQVTLPSFTLRQNVPVVSEADYLMDHLNDLNYDLQENKSVIIISSSDFDQQSRTESGPHPSPKAQAKHSTATSFDEGVVFNCHCLAIVLLDNFQRVSLS